MKKTASVNLVNWCTEYKLRAFSYLAKFVFQLSICCRYMLLILWTEKGLEMRDKNFRLPHTIFITAEFPGPLNYLCWWYEVLLTSACFLFPDYYQGPFDGKQHNLSICKQAGPGKLNQRIWSANCCLRSCSLLSWCTHTGPYIVKFSLY